jgi:hypothetical protein
MKLKGLEEIQDLFFVLTIFKYLNLKYALEYLFQS